MFNESYYVEKTLLAEINDKRNIRREYVKNIDPLRIENDSFTTSFRFFTYINNRKIYISPSYYFGMRMDVQDAINELECLDNMDWLIEEINKKGIKSVIFCDNGLIVTDINEGDMTVEEVKRSIMDKEEDKIQVNRLSFFQKLAMVLSCFEDAEFEYSTDTYSLTYPDINQRGYSVRTSYTTYSIYCKEKEYARHTMHSSTITKKRNVIVSKQCDCDKFASFSDIKKCITPLFETYPYLMDFIDEIRTICFNNNGEIKDTDISMWIKVYANNSMDFNNGSKVVSKMLKKTLKCKSFIR